MPGLTSRWSIEKARQWHAKLPWLVGCNFIPSTAVNQLEMWQAETFDPTTIDRELGWAEALGFNALRVFLHDLLWQQDAVGFLSRLRRFLDITQSHHMRVMFVFFEDCWHDDPHPGTQPPPIPGMHNSRWVKSPGSRIIRHPEKWERLADYVSGVISSFRDDERILAWDLYNEAGNNFLIALNKPKASQLASLLSQLLAQFLGKPASARLLRSAFNWARQAQPCQPLTAPTWYLPSAIPGRLNTLAINLSDVPSFHSYFPSAVTEKLIQELRRSGRPLLCTEYMARPLGSHFETLLPFFKQEKIGCFNWGLVSGKTQTIHSWKELRPNGEEPPTWFHDVLRPDGSLYREEEGRVIQALTSGQE